MSVCVSRIAWPAKCPGDLVHRTFIPTFEQPAGRNTSLGERYDGSKKDIFFVGSTRLAGVFDGRSGTGLDAVVQIHKRIARRVRNAFGRVPRRTGGFGGAGRSTQTLLRYRRVGQGCDGAHPGRCATKGRRVSQRTGLQSAGAVRRERTLAAARRGWKGRW